MTTSTTIQSEIALIKGLMVGLDGDNPALSQYQAILNTLYFNLNVAVGGGGAGIGSLATQVATPPASSSVGAAKNEAVSTRTSVNKTGALAALVTSMGLT